MTVSCSAWLIFAAIQNRPAGLELYGDVSEDG